MGIGAAFIFPTTLSILTNTFTGPERARAIGVWAGVSGIGVALGPMLGGLLVEHFYWGAVFLVNVPDLRRRARARLLLRPHVARPRQPPARPVRRAALDRRAGRRCSTRSSRRPTTGWTATAWSSRSWSALCLLGALRAGGRRTPPSPMLDLRVFRNPRFSAASAVLTLTSFALYGSMFLLTQYFQFVLGYSPLKAGLLAHAGRGRHDGDVAATRRSSSCRWGTKRVVVIGLLVIARLDAALRAPNTIMSSFVGGCVVRAASSASGSGSPSAPATESIMGSLPPSRAGVGSAINDTTRQTGGALGVAIIGSVFLAAYHHFADKAQRPLGGVVGRAARLGRAARSSSPATLPAKQGAALIELSRQAFVDAMRITYPIAAAFIVFAAFIAWRYLPARGQRRVRNRRRLRRSARDQRVRGPGRIASTPVDTSHAG